MIRTNPILVISLLLKILSTFIFWNQFYVESFLKQFSVLEYKKYIIFKIIDWSP